METHNFDDITSQLQKDSIVDKYNIEDDNDFINIMNTSKSIKSRIENLQKKTKKIIDNCIYVNPKYSSVKYLNNILKSKTQLIKYNYISIV